MKKSKKSKLSTNITLAISIIVIICIGMLYFTANSNMTTAMRKTAKDNMITSLDAKTQIIESYVKSAGSLLKAYGNSGEIADALKDEDNSSLQKAAQDYTQRYYKDLDNWEGLYLADWNTYVITHSNTSAIGITIRTGDLLKALQDSIQNSDGLYNAGIILSPASKQLVLSMYVPIFDEDGKTPLGFVGGGPFASNLKPVLDQMVIEGLPNVKYSLLNVNTGTYIFNEDESLINTDVEDPTLLSILDDIKNHSEVDKNTIEYTGTDGKQYVAVYKNMSEYGWALVLSDSSKEIYAEAESNRIVLGIICLLSIVLILVISLIIIKFKTKPLKKITNAAKEIADGNFNVELEVVSRDEIGQLSQTLNLTIAQLQNYQGYIDEFAEVLREMANGNITAELKREYTGQFAKLKTNFQNYIQKTSEVLREINVASEQVAGGSEQISNGAQALSQGATEQASSVEELSASITEISEHIRQNAESTKTASEISAQAGAGVTESSRKMGEMIQAMQDISSKSSEIGSIIKVIDNIAFQTNILALNAAVEAARAGEAGKGFAVVADEVRNLAGKSAEAAKNTTTLIEDTAQAVEKGTQIADETAKSLSFVVEKDEIVNQTIQKIATASEEQATGITQIMQGIEQISAVVQTNSATAEQSAAASEELSGQANMLKKLVSQFVLKE